MNDDPRRLHWHRLRHRHRLRYHIGPGLTWRKNVRVGARLWFGLWLRDWLRFGKGTRVSVTGNHKLSSDAAKLR